MSKEFSHVKAIKNLVGFWVVVSIAVGLVLTSLYLRSIGHDYLGAFFMLAPLILGSSIMVYSFGGEK